MEDKYTILECLEGMKDTRSELEIYDDVFSDFAVSFVYDLNAVEMFGESSFDKVLHWMAENIEIEQWEEDGCATCKVSEFIEQNYELFEKFCSEHNNGAYQMDSDDRDDNIEVALATVQSLIVGNYSDMTYDEFAKEIENMKETPSLDEER